MKKVICIYNIVMSHFYFCILIFYGCRYISSFVTGFDMHFNEVDSISASKEGEAHCCHPIVADDK